MRWSFVDDAGTTTLCSTINAGPSNAVFVSPAAAGDGRLSVFNNMDAFGEWTLTVDDVAAGDVGTLNAWSIHLDSGSPSCPEDNDWNCFLCDWSTLSNGNPGGQADDDDDNDDVFQSTFRDAETGTRSGVDVMERGDN